ncbi:MAG: hypothetical protein M1822_002196 [Bathelium mastoideum]|nr:MAG: hypothetical protein M1822_002196 [Bathelium mastoideum]
MEDIQFDTNVTFQDFQLLSLHEAKSVAESNRELSGAKDDVPAQIRLAARGPRQPTSPSRANYAQALHYKKHGIPSRIHPSSYPQDCQSTGGHAIMADVETGGRRQGGGHGGRGRFNPRKRRFREDDDDHHERRPQRRKYQEPLAQKVRRELLQIAESQTRTPEDDARNIATLVVEGIDDSEMITSFYELVLQLILEQPFKIPFVAVVIIYANQQKPVIAEEILARAGQKAQQCVGSGSWREFKLVLRFLACLQRICDGNGVFPILDELFNKAAELQEASADDAVGLELVKIILLTIPYALQERSPEFEARTLELLEKTEIIADAPHALLSLVDPYPAVPEGVERPTSASSVISILQKQLQRESGNNWEFACIPRLVQNVAPAPDGESGPKKHIFPTVVIPETVSPGPRPLFPEIYFSLYATQELETVPPITDIASTILRDALVDTINTLDYNRVATAKCLIDLDCYWAEGTFVGRGRQFDVLRELASEGKRTWKPEDMAVDAVFSQLFLLPTPEHRLIYFHSVITECCKVAPAAVAPSLGRAIRFLYRNIDYMDLELVYRFLDWFAHHLSNFEFRWKWTEWTDNVEKSNLHPKKAFVVGAIDKEIRLSFAKRIRETLPPIYHSLISKGKESDTPDFKYVSDQIPYATEAREMHGLLRTKAPDAAFANALTSIARASLEHSPTADPLLPATDAFVTAICFLGSKSLSHVLSCIDRCKERLLALGRGQLVASKPDTTTENGDNDILEAQPETITGDGAAVKRQIVQSVFSYWRDHPGIAVSIVDKLLNYTILTPLAVIEWALLPSTAAPLSDGAADGADTNATATATTDVGAKLAEAHVFEMVSATVGKVTGRVRQIVAARHRGDLPAEHVPILDETLERERADMRALLAAVRDAVGGVASGAADGMVDDEGGEDGGAAVEGQKLRREWGHRWARVFERKAVVEEGVVGEVAVQMAAEAARKAAEEAKTKAEEMKEGDRGKDEVAMEDANGAAEAHEGALNGEVEIS